MTKPLKKKILKFLSWVSKISRNLALMTGCASLSVAANASEYFLDSPSVPCSMLLQLEFSESIESYDSYIQLQVGPHNSRSLKFRGYDEYVELEGANKIAIVYKPKALSERMLVIQDRDLPCLAVLSSERPLSHTESQVQISQTNSTRAAIVSQSEVITSSTQFAQDVQVSDAAPIQRSGSTVTSKPTIVSQVSSPDKADIMVNEIQAQIILFEAVAEAVQEAPISRRDRILSVVDSEIIKLQSRRSELSKRLSQKFSTPIRPENSNLNTSAFRAAETFPKIPYFVPGTNEFGEMVVVPRVSDSGRLKYEFDFVDPSAQYTQIRERLIVSHEDIQYLIDGLAKVDDWTTVAQENNLTRRISKVASCFPTTDCKEKKVGNSSTEVVFQIYEDGSTAGRIQRNKGNFVTGYNFSVESSVLLNAYLIYMRDAGAREFNIGVMSDEQVLEMFD